MGGGRSLRSGIGSKARRVPASNLPGRSYQRGNGPTPVLPTVGAAPALVFVGEAKSPARSAGVATHCKAAPGPRGSPAASTSSHWDRSRRPSSTSRPTKASGTQSRTTPGSASSCHVSRTCSGPRPQDGASTAAPSQRTIHPHNLPPRPPPRGRRPARHPRAGLPRPRNQSMPTIPTPGLIRARRTNRERCSNTKAAAPRE